MILWQMDVESAKSVSLVNSLLEMIVLNAELKSMETVLV